MLTTIEGAFIGGRLSRRGQLKRLKIRTTDNTAGGQADRIQQIKIPKPLRPLLEQLLKSSSYLKLQVEAGHRQLKAVDVLMAAGECQPTIKQSKVSPITIQVCSKSSCHKRGSDQMCMALQAMIQKQHLQNTVSIEKVGCIKECKHAPNVRIKPSGSICHKASATKVFQSLKPLLNP
jgi:NADH:ubiquinone oxidoreductase subunit E